MSNIGLVTRCRDRLECWLDDSFGLRIESGELLVALLTCLLGALVIYATYRGVAYAAHQFRIANTIRYLERFSDPKFKAMIDGARNIDATNGPYWRPYGLTSDHADITYNEERIRFVRDAKEIANYFDYVGVLMKHGHIDRQLYFSQLCDVTIDNWKWLRPYIYYARMLRGDPFALKHRALFVGAAEALHDDPAATDALRDLNNALDKLTGAARTGADYQLWLALPGGFGLAESAKGYPLGLRRSLFDPGGYCWNRQGSSAPLELLFARNTAPR